jgi:hypothetical protein
MLFLGSLQTRFDQVDFRLGCGDSGLGLLLKTVQNIHPARQADRVNGTICVAVVVFDNFQHSRPSKASERFCAGVLSALLCHVKRKAYEILDLFGKSAQVRLGAPDPNYWFEAASGR